MFVCLFAVFFGKDLKVSSWNREKCHMPLCAKSINFGRDIWAISSVVVDNKCVIFTFSQLYLHCPLIYILIPLCWRLTRSLSLWPVDGGASWLCRHPGTVPSAGLQPHPACLKSQLGAWAEALSFHFQHPGRSRQQRWWFPVKAMCQQCISLCLSFSVCLCVLTTASISSDWRMSFSTRSAFVCIWAISKAKLPAWFLQGEEKSQIRVLI